MYPKPILINNKPYIYNIGSIYVSKTPQLILFSKDTYKNNCFYSQNLKKIFCRNSTLVRKCDYSILMNKTTELNSKCITKLPLTNYVMQTGFNLYFTLQSPININITCKNNTKQMHFEKSTNIFGIFNCTLKSENFILHTNTSIDYKIQALPNVHKEYNKYILFYYLYLFTLCFILIPNFIFMIIVAIKQKNLPENNNNNNTITYTTFENDPYNYNALPPQYRESLI